MVQPQVTLKSGGYLVINQAEALVAIDVNSGRSTRERNIEETALRTNLEAAEEVARQLRLRDLAGLIVIDFIDMDENRNNRTVERKLKEALKHDRARIQVGRISHFGLLEMSRQRIRSSVLESSTEKCPVCGGSGHVRSVSSVALQLLRAIEETMIKGATHNLIVRTRSEVALYVLNHKRAHLRALEERFRITITIAADATVSGQQSYVIERGEQVHSPEAARALAAQKQPELLAPVPESEGDLVEDEEEADETAEAAEPEAAESEGEPRRRRRRRGRGRGREGRDVRAAQDAHESAPVTHDTVAEHAIAHEDHDAGSPEEDQAVEPSESVMADDGQEGPGRRRRRRGRRGGRRNRGRNGEGLHADLASPDVELEHAVEDLDAGVGGEPSPLPVDRPPVPTAEAEFPPPAQAPVVQPAIPQAAAAEPREPETRSEPPRRRSTIREPAPSAGMGAPAHTPAPISAPEPVVSSTAPEPAAPRRGWWGRRLLGGK
jgi:ribonuclease E